MKLNSSTGITTATVAFIVITFLVIASMDNNTARNVMQGLILMVSLLLFTGIVVMRSKITQA
jgi:hypothetical protein